MKKQFILFCIAMGFTTSLWASDCVFFNVNVTNTNWQSCTFISGKVLSGYVENQPEAKLEWGMTQKFSMYQIDEEGSKVELRYECDGHKVAFISTQTHCDFFNGFVSGQVTYSDPGIQINFTKKDASSFWGTPGEINWVLQK